MRKRLLGIAAPLGLAIATYAVVVSSGDSGARRWLESVGDTAPAERRTVERARASEAKAAPVVAQLSGWSPPSAASSAGAAPDAPIVTIGPALSPAQAAGWLRVAAQARVLGRRKVLLEDEHGRAIKGGLPHRFAGAHGESDGAPTPITNEAALQSFHANLRALADGVLPGGKLRILAYGASHTQADLYTGYLRTYLQSRFGNGGPGFVQVSKIDVWDRKLEMHVQSEGFRLLRVGYRDPSAPAWFGLLGASAVARSNASAHVRLAAGSSVTAAPLVVELHCMGEPGAGDLELRFDGVVARRFSTHAQVPEPQFHHVEAPYGFSHLELRAAGNGPVRVFGVSIERSEPGIVLDTLGIQGTRMTDWLEWDEPVWRAGVERRRPHLVTMAYGTNETLNQAITLDIYRQNLDRALVRLKSAAPAASCLLIGPGDLGLTRTPQGRARLEGIIETQKEVALKNDCGFWDTYEFMGGRGAMTRWVSAQPAMASSDRTHLNRRGYVLMGMRLADALLRPIDERQ